MTPAQTPATPPRAPTPPAAGVAPEAPSPTAASRADVTAKIPDFVELTPPAAAAPASPLDFLLDVSVTATAELGRTVLSVGDVLKLGVGSVLRLDRPVCDMADLMVQGVRLARGEVVVVDDHFAIHIKEIAEPKKRG